jgi:uncharacterized membrane protein
MKSHRLNGGTRCGRVKTDKLLMFTIPYRGARHCGYPPSPAAAVAPPAGGAWCSSAWVLPSCHPLVIILTVLISFGFSYTPAYAQDTSVETGPDAFYQGRIVRIIEEKDEANLFNVTGAPSFSQKLKVEILNGPYEGAELELPYGGLSNDHKLHEGDTIIVVAPNGTANTDTFYIFDRYRLPALYGIVGFFVLLTILFARWRGLSSLLGLGVSVAVLTLYVVPRILGGSNPLIIILTGALVIATVSIYLAHGFNRRTSVAVGSTLISVGLAMVLSLVFVSLAKLLGIGSEEALYLQTASLHNINLKGLLLGGIIIGALGVLDDITTAQAAAVDEIAKANPALSRSELFKRGLSVGREHITSLVNTLVLAYAGASFPALLLFTIYERPWWVVVNTEVIAEEIIRTLVGSIALMCAVPITTALAAYFLSQRPD